MRWQPLDDAILLCVMAFLLVLGILAVVAVAP